ncbi:hypothetical protein PPL_09070 [Heterostelium album PN500]|uniref:Intimal thickness related receptor IRP domain-containing protein n=1 Tax=Heterostelium pallidum (strain ATCC 26659 / Pp 5 / PN500) TaxID=670386 RepID=D3BKI9_HETP5|nr:hypothetical protein PPL_09070 [Heterostelium album PN500]EFA78419.1 hypothetical protein PPL_09070 [Heterostelium album PN500]|eukprot:XP_020430544.1 hypothetical protein PPL_09070 [Heterostelium album PN500]
MKVQIKLLISVVLLVTLFATFTEAKYTKGHLKTSSSWAYLDKFCFGNHGQGHFTFSGKSSSPNIGLYIYDDVQGSWNSVYKSSKTCDEKTNISLPINPQPTFDGEKYTYPVNDFMRPHYWYLVAANCQDDDGINLEYTISWINAGGLWKAEFSYDDQGLEAMYLVYFWFFLLLGAYSCYSAWVLMSTKSFHPIVKLLTISIILEFLSVFILLIHYGAYSHDGVGAKGLQGFGELLDLGAQLTFILLLILIAKGWAISRVTIDEKKIILGVMGILSALYLIMFIWYKAGQDKASTVYMYDTVPGIILLVVRSLAMVWFMWCGYNTYMEENHPAKRKFYTYFGIAFVIWFLALPFICIVASAVDSWIRQKVVLAFYVTFNFLALAGLSILLSPSRASDYFTISGRVDTAGSVPYESI